MRLDDAPFITWDARIMLRKDWSFVGFYGERCDKIYFGGADSRLKLKVKIRRNASESG